MMRRQSGLGRGLGALIPADSVADPFDEVDNKKGVDVAGKTASDSVAQDDSKVLQFIAIEKVDPNPHQPRKRFDHGLPRLVFQNQLRNFAVYQKTMRPTDLRSRLPVF